MLISTIIYDEYIFYNYINKTIDKCVWIPSVRFPFIKENDFLCISRFQHTLDAHIMAHKCIIDLELLYVQ